MKIIPNNYIIKLGSLASHGNNGNLKN